MWECEPEAQSIAAAEGWHCPTCLSRRRPMETLSPQAYNLLGILISSEDQFDVIPPVEVCWECAGRLLSMLKFQERALRAMSLLLTCDIKAETNSFSVLTKATKMGVDYEFQDNHWDPLVQVGVNEPTVIPQKTINQTVKIVPMNNETHIIETTARESLKRKAKCTNGRVKKLYLSDEQAIKIRERDQKTEEYVKSPYKCEICIKPFTHKDLLDHHNMVKHDKDAPHECDICGERFARAAPLVAHRLRHRLLFACTACAFASRSGAEAVRRHHGDAHASAELSKFHCNKCDQTFPSKGQIIKHQKSDHDEYSCYICDKPLKSFATVQKHVRFMHEGLRLQRMHVCDVCGKRFQATTMLARHRLTHTGERPHVCDICGATFTQKSTLSTHVRVVHLKLGRKMLRPPHKLRAVPSRDPSH